MILHTLFYGKSKKRMHPIMTDSKEKCEAYQKARESSCNGWHEIKLAEKGSEIWKQKSATRGGNKSNGTGGYISKRGFNHHT